MTKEEKIVSREERELARLTAAKRKGKSSLYFWVLFAIILCGGLWGLVGMVICVPMFAVIYDVGKKLVRRGLINKNQFQQWDHYKADYPDEAPPK